MTRKQKDEAILSKLAEHYPNPETELQYQNPYQLLVAVMLSAQCTDKRVNMVTPAFFKSFPTIQALAAASIDDIYDHIKSISYPNSKAKHLSATAKKLISEFNGEIPLSVPQLITLPGVGRKTANVITSVLDNQPNMAVDTHVFRVSKRLGLTKQNTTTPLSAEKQLLKKIPDLLIPKAHHWLILHGRYVCKARKPDCENCPLQDECNYFQNNKH